MICKHQITKDLVRSTFLDLMSSIYKSVADSGDRTDIQEDFYPTLHGSEVHDHYVKSSSTKTYGLHHGSSHLHHLIHSPHASQDVADLLS